MPPDQTYFKNIQLQWTPFIEPTADFSSSDSLITLGDTIYFTDASSQSPTNWIWDFGDGTFSTDQNPWHIYQNPGIYTIALLAENSYGMDTIIRQNYIEVLDSTQISLPWIYSVTNYQHTIQIPANSSVTIDGYQIMYGDYLSVFFDSAGTQACAGYVKYTGLNLSLTAYGDDTQTSAIEGFTTNELINWKIYRKTDYSEFQATANYVLPPFAPNTGQFVSAGMSELISLSANTIEIQSISFNQGWNLFSTYIEPQNSNIDSVLSGISNDVIIVKDELGNIYWPSFGINSIGDMTLGKAYLAKLSSITNFTVEGLAVDPVTTILTINAGWSFLGYLRQNPAAIDSMLSSFVSSIIMVKSGDGLVYWPLYGVNNIVNMYPGKGYQIKLNSQVSFTYPANYFLCPYNL